jgi:hypothetical protein
MMWLDYGIGYRRTWLGLTEDILSTNIFITGYNCSLFCIHISYLTLPATYTEARRHIIGLEIRLHTLPYNLMQSTKGGSDQ